MLIISSKKLLLQLYPFSRSYNNSKLTVNRSCPKKSTNKVALRPKLHKLNTCKLYNRKEIKAKWQYAKTKKEKHGITMENVN